MDIWNKKASAVQISTIAGLLLSAQLANAELIESRELVPKEDVAFIEFMENSGDNWHGIIKTRFKNPDQSSSEFILLSFPTGAHSVDYASEHTYWEDKPEDLAFEPHRIASAQRLLARDVLKIADFNDLIDLLGIGYASEAGYATKDILPPRSFSIQVELKNYQKLVSRGYPTSLEEMVLSAALFGVGEVDGEHLEELIADYEFQSLDIFKRMTALRVGRQCFHMFNTASFQHAGMNEIAAIATVSGCEIAGLNIAFSNVKYVNRLLDSRHVIETANSLSEQTESYVQTIEIELQ